MEHSKGGTFAPADMPVIRRALDAYVKKILADEVAGQEGENPDLKRVINLQHRMGRINKEV